MGQKIYHGMLMPLHDSMPSFMNFRWVLDLLEFKSDGGGLFEIHSQFLRDLAYNQGHKFDFSTSLYAPEHVHVVQIWIVHIKCLENPVNA